MTTGTISDDVRTYLAAVRERLADLPAEEREHLLSDVEASLLEAPGDLRTRLGPPDRFADELRSAAGFPAPMPAAPPRRRFAALAALLRHPDVARLAPLWWVARGYLLVVLFSELWGRDWSTPYVVFPRIDTAGTTAALLVVAIAGSVWLGLRGRPVGRWWLVANIAVLVLGAPVAISQTAGHARSVTTVVQAVGVTDGLAYDGDQVSNVYPYDRKGRLLQDVRLYDQSGHPLNVGRINGDPERRVPRSRAGRPFANAFPIRYFKPGTLRVAHPRAGAPARPAPIVTPPVR